MEGGQGLANTQEFRSRSLEASGTAPRARGLGVMPLPATIILFLLIVGAPLAVLIDEIDHDITGWLKVRRRLRWIKDR